VASLRLSDEQAPKAIHRFTYGEVKKAGKDMDQLPPDKKEVTDGQIKEALKAFSVEEWRRLVHKLERRDLDAVVGYLQNDPEAMADDKCRCVHDIAAARGLAHTFGRLAQSGYKEVVISDPMWAAVFWRRAREDNLRHRPGSEKRTRAESGRYAAVSESLGEMGRKVHDRQVKRWLDRLRAYPEWKDFLDRRGPMPDEITPVDFDFWHKVADPNGYKRSIRRRERRQRKD
jgi:hypothetical protein